MKAHVVSAPYGTHLARELARLDAWLRANGRKADVNDSSLFGTSRRQCVTLRARAWPTVRAQGHRFAYMRLWACGFVRIPILILQSTGIRSGARGWVDLNARAGVSS